MTKKKTPEKLVFPNNYRVVAADLSLRRPGWCLLSVVKSNDVTSVTVEQLVSVDNKANKKKTHGEILAEIQGAFINLCFPVEPNTFYVREQEVLHMKVPSERDVSKVVGLMDYSLWKLDGKEWFSIYPVTVKKLVAGSGKAEKSEVAAALEKYIGKQEYKCDDESDAVAVGIAWLIQQGQIEEIKNG